MRAQSARLVKLRISSDFVQIFVSQDKKDVLVRQCLQAQIT